MNKLQISFHINNFKISYLLTMPGTWDDPLFSGCRMYWGTPPSITHAAPSQFFGILLQLSNAFVQISLTQLNTTSISQRIMSFYLTTRRRRKYRKVVWERKNTFSKICVCVIWLLPSLICCHSLVSLRMKYARLGTVQSSKHLLADLESNLC